MRLLMWALIQYDWHLYKKRRLGHRHAGRKDHVKTKVKVAQSCPILWDCMNCSLPGSCRWNSPGKNTGVGSCSLLQGIFPTQESNPGLQHCRWILYQLSHKGSCMHAKSLQWCPTVSTLKTIAARLLCPWDSPGKNTGVGCHVLPQFTY